MGFIISLVTSIFFKLLMFVVLAIYFLLCIILTVAFLTLFERKVLGSMQKRKGPNMTGFLGLMQPITDALKLLIKENTIPQNASSILFFFGPFALLLLSLTAWFVIPFNEKTMISNINIGILYIFMISSLNSLNIVISGWASNSRYAFLGALRSIAQIIAYEVVIGILIINILVLSGSLNLMKIVYAQKNVWFGFFLWFQVALFFVAMLAETNRHPFDLAEAESELVSGYNVEHGSILFAAFSLAEYANILLLCHVGTILFLGGWTLPNVYFFWQYIDFYGYLDFHLAVIDFQVDHPLLMWLYHSVIYNVKIFLYLFSFLWARAALPRYRYDQLMRLGWKVFVPISLGLFFVSVGLTYLFDGFPPEGGCSAY